tara:strand:- start:1523 stop:3142 length:1620 start_codon:yes stop_codon:yes gene_type:complete
MIIVVADMFSNQFTGGAELTSDALLELGFDNYKKINSQNLDEKILKKYQDKKWIFFNFEHVSKKCLLKTATTIKDYSVVEYDYKYCKHRLKSKHESTGEKCECEESARGKLTAIFLAKSKNLFFMSSGQKKEYEKIYPILKKHNNSYVLNSSFSSKKLDHMASLDVEKNDQYIILNSDSWVKGTQNCVEYAESNNLKYELVGGLPHEELLKKLAQSKGLIFLPNGFDTCPRIVIEAKLLGCEVILNDNVQHKEEKWFKTPNSIVNHIKKQKQFFYDKCLRQNLQHEKKEQKTRFHFIIPGYNVTNWIERLVSSIQRQEYENYSVTYIDDMSTDNTSIVYQELTSNNKKFKIIENKKKNYALKNISNAIDSLKDSQKEDVIIVLDADDWLSSPQVLSYLNSVYQDDDCWMTYGSYMYYPFGDEGVEPSDYPEEIIKNNMYREDDWRATHLRTFKKKLWVEINQQDFIDEDGEYYKMAYDQAMMLPMLEMAREKAKYIPEILHVYNRANALNVDKIKQQQQYKTMLRIRKKNRYERINFED